MGKFWSIEAVAKDKSTSLFGTIVLFPESRIKRDLCMLAPMTVLFRFSEDAKHA
jgi:hypothetical protein